MSVPDATRKALFSEAWSSQNSVVPGPHWTNMGASTFVRKLVEVEWNGQNRIGRPPVPTVPWTALFGLPKWQFGFSWLICPHGIVSVHSLSNVTCRPEP